MNNPWDELTAALQAAQEVNNAVRSHRDSMLRILDGNLKGASVYYLDKIKRQLRDYNIRTGKWKR